MRGDAADVIADQFDLGSVKPLPDLDPRLRTASRIVTAARIAAGL